MHVLSIVPLISGTFTVDQQLCCPSSHTTWRKIKQTGCCKQDELLAGHTTVCGLVQVLFLNPNAKLEG